MKEEVKKLISEKLNKLGNQGEQIGRFTDISILERIGEYFGVDKLNEVLENSNLRKISLEATLHIPSFLLDFISKIENNLKGDNILDPCATKNSLNFRNNIQKKYYCINQSEFEFLTKVANINKSIIQLGDSFELLNQEKNTFDFIVSFPPFRLNSMSINNSTTKDYATNLLISSSFKLNKDGVMGFLMPGRFLFDEKIKNSLKANGVFINGLFYLPEGSHKPTISISSYFVVASKNNLGSTFIAALSRDKNINNTIFENFKKRRSGKAIELGGMVDYYELKSFWSYKAYEINHRLTQLGKRTGNNGIKLSDISKTKTIKDVEPENVEHLINSIYIPKVGNSKVVDNPKDFLIKPKNYLQVTLDDKFSNSTYLSNYFNTHIGRLSIESCKVGTVIGSLSINSLLNCILFIPSINDQLEVIKVNQQIEKYSQELIELQDKLWKRPSSFQEVNKVITKFVKDKSIINWLDDLPFPLSSILWKYQATTDSKNKIEHLFHFFEAFSEFIALIMLSAFNQNKEFYKTECHRWIKDDSNYIDWIKKTTFGGWNNLTANLSKATRTLLNDKEKKEIIKSLFGNPSKEFFDFITNKGIFNILNETREYRNKWKGHGGVSSEQDNKNRIIILEQKLTELRQIIKDGFSDFRLISAGSSVLEDGVNVCKVRELIGTRTPFNETEITSLIQLDIKKLYFITIGSNKPIELLPFIKYNQENKACYFYSSIESNGIRWVSFHYEKNSEINELLDEKFKEVLNLLNKTNNK